MVDVYSLGMTLMTFLLHHVFDHDPKRAAWYATALEYFDEVYGRFFEVCASSIYDNTDRPAQLGQLCKLSYRMTRTRPTARLKPRQALQQYFPVISAFDSLSNSE
jgi:hypothetical protein